MNNTTAIVQWLFVYIYTMADKKIKILESAITLFVKSGFDRVSTAEISKNAGVATGTMFYHFKTKEDIIIEAYKRIKKQIIHINVRGSQNDYSKREELKILWDKIIQWGLENPENVYYLLQFKNSPYYSTNLMIEDDTWQSRLHWWQQGIDDKIFKEVPLDFLLKTFNDLLFGTIEYLLREPKDVAYYLDTSFALCWDCISDKH